MRSQHITMTGEEFQRMPRRLGWKYEYWDGQAHISPGYQIVTVSVGIKPRPVESACHIQAVDERDEAQLISAYFAAFSETTEFCDWKREKILDAARKDIQEFLAGKRGNPHPSSRVAVASGEESIVGATLVICGEPPCLQMLFVIPEWHRRGVATALVSSAVNELHRAEIKTLESRYLLGNEGSRAWHQEFGFVEQPDLFLARLYYRHAQYELWRREEIGDLIEAERKALSSEVNRWKVRIDELEGIAEREGIEAVLPEPWR
ncbi:GNAT family N-acetyltransferase [Candidatus Poribacteria bacterium]|nr:GNAT family N-acetyltransferase [Candidatus Poribacteria bacterium]